LIKLIDFGNAFKADLNKKNSFLGMVGCHRYMAPEIFRKYKDYKFDIWSAGVVMFVLLTGNFPFDHKSKRQIIKQVQKGKPNFIKKDWKHISTEAKDLINMIFNINPNERPSASQCLNHPWFKKTLQKSSLTD